MELKADEKQIRSGNWKQWLRYFDQWLRHPEKLWLHRVCFQIHYWVGIVAGLYVLVMSLSGSILVYADAASQNFPVQWLVKLHENLGFGSTGRIVNGIGALALTLLCLTGAIIWWPGIQNWRRSLTINWRLRFARFTWDLHSALGFWSFPFVLLWAISGLYLCFPDAFSASLAFFYPQDNFYDQALAVLADLHFGRFNWFTEAVWTVLGLVTALLAVSGIFVCCHRMMYKKSANPNRQVE